MPNPHPQPNPPSAKTPSLQPDIFQDISIELVTLRFAIYRLFQLALSDHPLQPLDLWKLVFIARMLIACLNRLSRLVPSRTQRKAGQEDAISRAISQALAEMAAGFPRQ